MEKKTPFLRPTSSLFSAYSMPLYALFKVYKASGVKCWTYRVPGDEGVGQKGPNGSRGGPTGSKGVKGRPTGSQGVKGRPKWSRETRGRGGR